MIVNFADYIFSTLQGQTIKLYEYNHSDITTTYEIQKSPWHGCRVTIKGRVSGVIKELKVSKDNVLKMKVDINGTIHKVQAFLSDDIELGALDENDKLDLDAGISICKIYIIYKNNWIHIFGEEPKPEGNITLRYLETPNSTPQYLEGVYDKKRKKYLIGDKVIPQNKITHYMIVSDNSNISEPKYL